jgi:protein-tyrosine-phosphatase
VTLRQDRLDEIHVRPDLVARRILFVCTHNSARSQFAAGYWERTTGRPAESAGTDPAPRVHPAAVRVAREFGVDLAGAEPRGYGAVTSSPDLVVSVCDRAYEAGWPFDAPVLHWSVPDPVRTGTDAAVRRAFTELAARIERAGAPH